LPHPFIPHRLLRNRHAQTIAGWAWKPRIALPPAEDRLFEVAAGVQVLCRCHWQVTQNSKRNMQDSARAAADGMTLLLVHGLEGSSESNYIRGTASKAFAAGMNVVRMNIRNCGGTEHLSRTLYHSGLSEDVGEVGSLLAKDERVGVVAIAGFSLGGNQVLKLAGEWGGTAPPYVCGVVAVSPAVDLDVSCDLLHLWRNRIYEWQFLRSLKRRVSLKEKINGTADIESLRAIRSMREFDDRVTAPSFGFAGARDYYARASASPLLERISLPTLVIFAEDDPFICLLPKTRERLSANPNITTLRSEHGGHCAFVARGGHRWAEEQIVAFFSSQIE